MVDQSCLFCKQYLTYNMSLIRLILICVLVVVSQAGKPKCLNTGDFVKKITKSEDLLGDWSMAHVKPLGGQGFNCPAPKVKVVPVTSEDIEHWKNKCLHKLDISVLDERKFELQVTFPDNFETHFTIIRRDKNEDHMLFPSCIFEKIDFYQKDEIKMWIATREEDGKRLPIAVQAPSWEESRCVLNDDDRLYYFFC